MGQLSILIRASLVSALALTAGNLTLAVRGGSTIDPLHPAAWAANLGWINCSADLVNGAVVGESICSGFFYSGNVGWIRLGTGSPANGVRYLNNSAADFGVNHDGLGNLNGLAWGANIGWLMFTNRDTSGALIDGPRVDLATGKLSGHIFSANAGWISLSNAVAHVRTERIAPGTDSDGDGIADAFEIAWTAGLTAMNASSDLDADGSADRSEYLAATNPNDPTDRLEVTALSVGPGGSQVVATWTTRPSRFYRLQQRTDVTTNSIWLDSGLGLLTPDGGATTTRTVPIVPAPRRFFRVEAVPPLSP